MTEKQKDMEAEIEALRKAARDRETDLITLNTVLQCNQDVLNVMRRTAGSRRRQLPCSLTCVSSTAGPASGSGGEGAAVDGGGEREGDVETEEPGPRCRPAGEGRSDPLARGGA